MQVLCGGAQVVQSPFTNPHLTAHEQSRVNRMGRGSQVDLCKNFGFQSLCEVRYFALGYIGRWALEVTFLLILAAASTDGVTLYWVKMKHMKGKGNVLVDIGFRPFMCSSLLFKNILRPFQGTDLVLHFQFQNCRGPPRETLASPRHSGLRSQGGARPLSQERAWRRSLTEAGTPSKWRR